MKIDSSKGIGDFYEAIPTLIVVTVGLLIFMTTVIKVYSNYIDYQQNQKLERKTSEFMNFIRSYDVFLYEDQGYKAGSFSVAKLEELKTNKTLVLQKLKNAFNVDFEFKIEILDVSSYCKKYDFEFSTIENEEPKIGIYKLESSANIVVSSNEAHVAKLILSVWD